MILNVIQEFVLTEHLNTPFKNGQPGGDWFLNFCKKNELRLKNCESLQSNRQQNTSDPFIIYDFYDLLQSAIRDLQLEDKPSHIWNLDESGFNHDPSKVKGVMGTHVNPYRVIMGSGKLNTTILATAAGRMLPPLIIMKGKGTLWSNWRGSNDMSGVMYSVSENRFITTEIFESFFEIFCSVVKERPLLLIFDGHITHLVSMRVI